MCNKTYVYYQKRIFTPGYLKALVHFYHTFHLCMMRKLLYSALRNNFLYYIKSQSFGDNNNNNYYCVLSLTIIFFGPVRH